MQLLAVQRLYLAQVRQLDPEFVEGAMEQLLHLRLIPAQPALEAGIGVFARHRLRAVERVEPAQVS